VRLKLGGQAGRHLKIGQVAAAAPERASEIMGLEEDRPEEAPSPLRAEVPDRVEAGLSLTHGRECRPHATALSWERRATGRTIRTWIRTWTLPPAAGTSSSSCVVVRTIYRRRRWKISRQREFQPIPTIPSERCPPSNHFLPLSGGVWANCYHLS